jgi:steroid 5-alpha reductase family enzyme
MIDILVMMVWCAMTLSLWMFGLWVVYLFVRNIGIVDIGWALSFALAMTVAALIGPGVWQLKLFLSILVYCWALRLAVHLFIRFLRTPEDPRYTRLSQKWGQRYRHLKVLALFLFQGLLATLISIPFYVICLTPTPDWYPVQSLGVLVWLGGLIGESIADKQLAQFKQNPLNTGKVCDHGLWAYSRHPNYFFEWVVWMGFALIATPAPYGSLAWLSPCCMLYLLLRVSGVPLTEEQALTNKSEAYREYQRKTSAFFPWPPRR